MKATLIIPARYASSRFRGKMLAMLRGKTVIQRVYEQARKVNGVDRVIVATDDSRIYSHVKSFGSEVVMTPTSLSSGTSRCAFAAKKLGIIDGIVVNIQGDEPFLEPRQVEQLLDIFKNPEAEIGTLIKRVKEAEELFNPNRPKVVIDKVGRALYFSRQAIPFVDQTVNSAYLASHDFYKHIGLYAFRATILQNIALLPTSKLEKIEGLEQLCWLVHGYDIYTNITKFESLAIDTIADLERAFHF